MTAAATALEHFVTLPSAQQGDAIVQQIDLRKGLGIEFLSQLLKS